MAYSAFDNYKNGMELVERIVGGMRDAAIQRLNLYKQSLANSISLGTPVQWEHICAIQQMPQNRRDRLQHAIDVIEAEDGAVAGDGQARLVTLVNATNTISAADWNAELIRMETYCNNLMLPYQTNGVYNREVVQFTLFDQEPAKNRSRFIHGNINFWLPDTWISYTTEAELDTVVDVNIPQWLVPANLTSIVAELTATLIDGPLIAKAKLWDAHTVGYVPDIEAKSVYTG